MQLLRGPGSATRSVGNAPTGLLPPVPGSRVTPQYPAAPPVASSYGLSANANLYGIRPRPVEVPVLVDEQVLNTAFWNWVVQLQRDLPTRWFLYGDREPIRVTVNNPLVAQRYEQNGSKWTDASAIQVFIIAAIVNPTTRTDGYNVYKLQRALEINSQLPWHDLAFLGDLRTILLKVNMDVDFERRVLGKPWNPVALEQAIQLGTFTEWSKSLNDFQRLFEALHNSTIDLLNVVNRQIQAVQFVGGVPVQPIALPRDMPAVPTIPIIPLKPLALDRTLVAPTSATRAITPALAPLPNGTFPSTIVSNTFLAPVASAYRTTLPSPPPTASVIRSMPVTVIYPVPPDIEISSTSLRAPPVFTTPPSSVRQGRPATVVSSRINVPGRNPSSIQPTASSSRAQSPAAPAASASQSQPVEPLNPNVPSTGTATPAPIEPPTPSAEGSTTEPAAESEGSSSSSPSTVTELGADAKQRIKEMVAVTELDPAISRGPYREDPERQRVLDALPEIEKSEVQKQASDRLSDITREIQNIKETAKQTAFTKDTFDQYVTRLNDFENQYRRLGDLSRLLAMSGGAPVELTRQEIGEPSSSVPQQPAATVGSAASTAPSAGGGGKKFSPPKPAAAKKTVVAGEGKSEPQEEAVEEEKEEVSPAEPSGSPIGSSSVESKSASSLETEEVPWKDLVTTEARAAAKPIIDTLEQKQYRNTLEKERLRNQLRQLVTDLNRALHVPFKEAPSWSQSRLNQYYDKRDAALKYRDKLQAVLNASKDASSTWTWLLVDPQRKAGSLMDLVRTERKNEVWRRSQTSSADPEGQERLLVEWSRLNSPDWKPANEYEKSLLQRITQIDKELADLDNSLTGATALSSTDLEQRRQLVEIRKLELADEISRLIQSWPLLSATTSQPTVGPTVAETKSVSTASGEVPSQDFLTKDARAAAQQIMDTLARGQYKDNLQKEELRNQLRQLMMTISRAIQDKKYKTSDEENALVTYVNELDNALLKSEDVSSIGARLIVDPERKAGSLMNLVRKAHVAELQRQREAAPTEPTQVEDQRQREERTRIYRNDWKPANEYEVSLLQRITEMDKELGDLDKSLTETTLSPTDLEQRRQLVEKRKLELADEISRLIQSWPPSSATSQPSAAASGEPSPSTSPSTPSPTEPGGSSVTSTSPDVTPSTSTEPQGGTTPNEPGTSPAPGDVPNPAGGEPEGAPPPPPPGDVPDFGGGGIPPPPPGDVPDLGGSNKTPAARSKKPAKQAPPKRAPAKVAPPPGGGGDIVEEIRRRAAARNAAAAKKA